MNKEVLELKEKMEELLFYAVMYDSYQQTKREEDKIVKEYKEKLKPFGYTVNYNHEVVEL